MQSKNLYLVYTTKQKTKWIFYEMNNIVFNVTY